MNSSSIPELCCIDFPGYSATPKNLVDLAGGSTGIQKSFQKGVSLPLYLRPKDPFSRPIVGEIVPTGNLLIKLIKKKNKRTGEIKLDYEVVGFINKTARYRAIADYQVVPDAKDPIVKLRKDMQEWNRKLIV